MDKSKQNINKSINCSLKLIRKAADEKFIKQLALFHHLKFQFRNSVIFSYKSRMNEIAQSNQLSEKTLYTYLQILNNKGLTYRHSNNLCLVSIRNLKSSLNDKKHCRIVISESDQLFDIECRLYAKLFERHARKLAFMEAFRRFGNRELRDVETIENDFQPSLSVRNVANLLNVNEKKALRIIKRLNVLQIIKTETQPPKFISREIGGFNPEHFEDMPGYRFVFDGKLFLQYGSKHDLIDYPVSFPKISFKKFTQTHKSINQ